MSLAFQKSWIYKSQLPGLDSKLQADTVWYRLQAPHELCWSESRPGLDKQNSHTVTSAHEVTSLWATLWGNHECWANLSESQTNAHRKGLVLCWDHLESHCWLAVSPDRDSLNLWLLPKATSWERIPHRDCDPPLTADRWRRFLTPSGTCLPAAQSLCLALLISCCLQQSTDVLTLLPSPFS